MADRGVAMRKTYRFSFDEEQHKDVINMIDRCPKPLRSELIIMALRYMEQNKRNIISQVIEDDKGNRNNNEQAINLLNAFKEV